MIMNPMIIDANELNLKKSLRCGQFFRSFSENSIDYFIWRENIIPYEQNDDFIVIYFDNEDDLQDFKVFLDFNMNYNTIMSELNLDTYAKSCYEYAKGIHIFKQDLFECIVTFLMSSNNTMKNITNIVNNLSEKFGKPLERKHKGTTLQGYSFPSLNTLYEASIEDLELCKCGFRARYLKDFLNMLADDSFFFKELELASTLEVTQKLKSIKGIGDKIANCVSLFGLHRLEAFPIDIHIQCIIKREYNGNIDLARYGGYAGLIQQYLFHKENF